MEYIKNKIDIISSTLSMLCVIQCLLFPLIPLLSVFTESISHSLEHNIISISLVFAVITTAHTYRKHNIKLPLFFSIIACFIYTYNILYAEFHNIHVLVSVLIATTHILNYSARKNKCKHPHNNCN